MIVKNSYVYFKEVAMKKYKSDLKSYTEALLERVERWKYINDNGCTDPQWADGSNMNLARNHIIYYKRCINEICSKEGIPLPEEYYIPTPPPVDNNYMANYNDKKRVKRLKIDYQMKLTNKKAQYDDTQLNLF